MKPESITTKSVAELQQEIVCLKSALTECDQLVVRVRQEVGFALGKHASVLDIEVLEICTKAQNEMRTRIRDATGNF
jgi:hypothetical protein